MRKVDRSTVEGPASLLLEDRAGKKELARARAHFLAAPDGASFTFRAYKGDDVRHALEALFHGKCAYCESRYDTTSPVDIEHFRPKGAVEGIVHPGYWWLAAEWTNLLPSCIDCNRRRRQNTPIAFASLTGGLEAARQTGFRVVQTGKESAFPIRGTRMEAEPPQDQRDTALLAEECLLIDPCRTDPEEYLRFHVDRQEPLGIVYPAGSTDIVLPAYQAGNEQASEIENQARQAHVSVHGAVSIHVYGLNRLALVQERTRLLWRLEFLASVVLDVFRIADSLKAINVPDAEDSKIRDRAVARLEKMAGTALAEIRDAANPEAPFSAMARAWIKDFMAALP